MPLQTTFSRPKQNVILAKSRLPVKHFFPFPKTNFRDETAAPSQNLLQREAARRVLFVAWMSIGLCQAKRHYRHRSFFVKQPTRKFYHLLLRCLGCSFGAAILSTPRSSLYSVYCASVFCPLSSPILTVKVLLSPRPSTRSGRKPFRSGLR